MNSPGVQSSGRSVTLQDVAREADVAVSTVSRALSNPDRVSGPMRERIQEVAKRLGYTSGRAPVRSSLLALMVSGIGNPYNAALIRGGGVPGPRRGFVVDHRRHRRRAGGRVGAPGAAGRPRCRRSRPGVEHVAGGELRSLDTRAGLVLFNREVAGFPSVLTDSRDSSRQIVEHLAALGHRSIAYLSGPPALWTDSQRWHGLTDHAARLGVDIVRLGPFMPTLDQGTAAADVGLGSGATALVAFNDLLAIGMLQRLRQRKVNVPEAISVVGHDDIFGADFCRAVVDDESQRRGARRPDARRPGLGADRQSTRYPPIVIPTQLVVRDSTGPVARS